MNQKQHIPNPKYVGKEVVCLYGECGTWSPTKGYICVPTFAPFQSHGEFIAIIKKGLANPDTIEKLVTRTDVLGLCADDQRWKEIDPNYQIFFDDWWCESRNCLWSEVPVNTHAFADGRKVEFGLARAFIPNSPKTEVWFVKGKNNADASDDQIWAVPQSVANTSFLNQIGSEGIFDNKLWSSISWCGFFGGHSDHRATRGQGNFLMQDLINGMGNPNPTKPQIALASFKARQSAKNKKWWQL